MEVPEVNKQSKEIHGMLDANENFVLFNNDRTAKAVAEQHLARELETIHREGFVILEGVLNEHELNEIRAALAPHLKQNVLGRNNFEGR